MYYFFFSFKKSMCLSKGQLLLGTTDTENLPWEEVPAHPQGSTHPSGFSFLITRWGSVLRCPWRPAQVPRVCIGLDEKRQGELGPVQS